MFQKILFALIFTILVTGCAPDIIKSNKYDYNFNISLGQELIDLRKALDEGAINKEQYDEMFESLKQSRFNE